MKRSAAASRSSVERPGRMISRMCASVPATILPARPIVSISLGDLSVIMLPSDSLADAPGDLLHGADRRDPADGFSSVVPGQDRGGLGTVGLEAGGHGSRVVVRPLFQRSAA